MTHDYHFNKPQQGRIAFTTLIMENPNSLNRLA
jgi:hypothetical protein